MKLMFILLLIAALLLPLFSSARRNGISPIC